MGKLRDTSMQRPSGRGLKRTCLTFLTPMIVQCLRSDSSYFGHYRACKRKEFYFTFTS